ncbi:UPF0496 protein At3g49070 [Malania oleifera]|uniref:UPF0496 protein At3g49070 n=1 Tax=Malania oleifera TaxID=397392 RepID=UPI0025ADB692|nr:UPF0496 protein At3g49070 [Malania oleifera]
MAGDVVTGSSTSTSTIPAVDVREEYANAFRTQSYDEFWTRVLALTHKDVVTCNPIGSTTSARLPSYRLFMEHLLDPDQSTITRILNLTTSDLVINHSLLSDYFSETANASLLCTFLLKNIDQTRVKYRALRKFLESLEISSLPVDHHPPEILTRLTELTNSFNPFVASALSSCRFRVVQVNCSGLLKRLETTRDHARAKLQLVNRIRHGSAIFLVMLTATLATIMVFHALAAMVAAPSLIAASFDPTPTKKLTKALAQLDAAAKGTYILNRDLDTISRHLARLNDELEHVREMIGFWLERGEDRLQPFGEVARQFKKNDSSFSQQLDELEEHLYLCLMTINRARNLVLNEIQDPGQVTRDPNT